MSYARQLLVEILLAQGMGEAEATKVVGLIVDRQLACDMMPAEHLDTWERGARAYHLRGQRLTVEVISARVCLGRSQVFEAIKRHEKRRRAALRQAS